MRPLLATLFALSLAFLPACGGLKSEPLPSLREVVFTLPESAHNKFTSRMAEFARDHDLEFLVSSYQLERGLDIQMWRGFAWLSAIMLSISNAPDKPETVSLEITDGIFRRAAPNDVEFLSRDFEKAITEVPGVTIISAKTCPC